MVIEKMNEKNKYDLLKLLHKIARRGTTNGDVFEVRQEDLDKIWEIVRRDDE